MEILKRDSTCENSLVILNRAVPDQVSTGSYQNGTRFNKDAEISRKLAFLTRRVQELESKLDSQEPIPHESSGINLQIRPQNFKTISVEPALCSSGSDKILRGNSAYNQRDEPPGFENFASVNCERMVYQRKDSTPKRNTPVLIMPVELNKAGLARLSFEREKQTLPNTNTSEPINGTCHIGIEVENSLQSGSFVNSWRSNAPSAIKSTISTVQNSASQQHRVQPFWENILCGKGGENCGNPSASVYPQEVCLPKRPSESYPNTTTSLNKPMNDLNKTYTGCRGNSYSSPVSMTAQVPKSHVIEVLSDESSRSNYGYTIRVAKQWVEGPSFGRSATLNTHESLMTPSEDVHVLKSVQIQRNECLTPSKVEGLACGKRNKLHAIEPCESPTKLENLVETTLTNGIDCSVQESHSSKDIRGPNNTFESKFKPELAQVSQNHAVEKLAQKSTFVSKLSQHRNQNTNTSNLYSRSSDRLINFYVNGDPLDSEDGREYKGTEGQDQETDSSFDETDDEKSYSICVTGGGEITLMGSDRFTSSEMSYDSIVKDAIEMQMSSSDTQKACDKKSIDKGQQTVLNNRSNYHEIVDLTLKNNRKNNLPSKYQDWTSSDSETMSPRQQSSHRPNRDSRRKVKVTYVEIQTPQKHLVENCNKKKSREKSPKRKTKYPETTRTGTTEVLRPKTFDFSSKGEKDDKCHVNVEECLRELIEPKQTRPSPPPVTKEPLSGFGSSPTEGSSGFNETSSLTNGEEEPLIVATRVRGTHTARNATRSYQYSYPGKTSTHFSRESSADSPYSSLTSINSDLSEPECQDKHFTFKSTKYTRDGREMHELRSPREEKQPSNWNIRDCDRREERLPSHNALQNLNNQSIEPTNRQMQLVDSTSSRDHRNEFQPIIPRLYASSPVSSVETSDFSLSDDVFADCKCRHYCQCQTGILTKDDFIEELKSASHYLLTKRQNAPLNSKSVKDMRTSKYHLDDEEGESNLLEYQSKANGRIATKELPMVVKVILRLRKHFFGNFEHQRLPVKDRNNDGRSTQRNLALSRENAGTKRISFSPSAMLLSAVGERSISEIREVVEKGKVDVNQLSPSGRTLLHKAASAGDIESIRTLISYGADVNLTDQYGFPPLNSALAHEHYKCAMFLIEQGTDLNLYTQARIHEYYEVKDMQQRNINYDLNTIV